VKIALDTKDLIDLERQNSLRDQFCTVLTEGRHELVLSFANISEIASPPRPGSLWTPRTHIPPHSFLQYLEDLPRTFIQNPIRYELRQAADDFGGAREYQAINPFKERFDQILAKSPATDDFVGLMLPEIVHRLGERNGRAVIDPYREYLPYFSQMIESDRKVAQPNRRQHFRQVIRKDLQSFGLETTKADEFADWIHADSQRCPSKHLSYGIHWSLVKNRDENLKGNLIADIIHAHATPYVDFITLDRTMRGHVIRSSQTLKEKVCKNLEDVLAKIQSSGPST